MRHKRSKHQEVLSVNPGQQNDLYCSKPGCNRSALSLNHPFTRKDHLQQHMRRAHKELSSDPRDDSPKDLNSFSMNFRDSIDLGLAERTDSVAGKISGVGQSTGKRKRPLDGLKSVENANYGNETLKRLLSEKGELITKVVDLERRLEVSEKRVLNLVDVMTNMGVINTRGNGVSHNSLSNM